jgi:transposase
MRALNSALYRFRCVIICSSASTSATQPFYLHYLSSFRGTLYTIAYKTNRAGGAERFADPAVQQSIDGELALLGADDELLRDVELTLVNTAQHHAATTLYLLPTVPGIGTILRLVLLYAIHQIDRFPRGQDVASDGRLVKWAKAAAGKRSGTAGTTIGHAHLTWAFSEAAAFFLRDHPEGPKCLVR